jgi:hypothetical protein
MTSTITFTFQWPKDLKWQYAAIKADGTLDFFLSDPKDNPTLFCVYDDDEGDPAIVTPAIIKRPNK